ncbi:unnamed protein product [Caenorhabditis auriculariae]|uniref:Uncharacterized protein n=1 Tax=Caenorhabditis auriculariae TaxID=2777116 RepID=A0A8S1HV42_9PELO|nr:unnamed protein product [Caenorhabditis auriculariae]
MQRANVEMLEKTLFTTSKSDEALHPCVVVLDSKHAVSFFHGPHSSLKLNETLSVYSVYDSTLHYQTLVHATSVAYDVVVLKIQDGGEFPFYPKGFESLYRGQHYLQLGISPNRMPTWKDRVVSDRFGGYYVGTSWGQSGDSGSGIFNSSGYFLGMSVGKEVFVFNDSSNMPLAEVANHRPDSKIISSDVILGIAGIGGPGLEPVEKRCKTDKHKAEPMRPPFSKDACRAAKSCKLSDYKGQPNFATKCDTDRKGYLGMEWKSSLADCSIPQHIICSYTSGSEDWKCLEHENMIYQPMKPNKTDSSFYSEAIQFYNGLCYEIICNEGSFQFVSGQDYYDCKKEGDRVTFKQKYGNNNHFRQFYEERTESYLSDYIVDRTVICPKYCDVCAEKDPKTCKEEEAEEGEDDDDDERGPCGLCSTEPQTSVPCWIRFLVRTRILSDSDRTPTDLMISRVDRKALNSWE